MRFIIFVEGETEQKAIRDFFKRYLDHHINPNIGLRMVLLKGGDHFNRKIEKRAKMHLNGPNSNKIIGVIGLLDLYGADFLSGNKAEEKITSGKNDFEKRVNHPKFKMFFAVHELEAWLLSDPKIFPQKIQKEIESMKEPEKVNFRLPPAKRLQNLYRDKLGKGYKKVVDGATLFKQLDPQIAYQKCPQFKKLMDAMVEMASQH